VSLVARLFGWLRRKPPPPVFAEDDAYSRLHGKRSGEVHVVPVTADPPPPRTLPRLAGDYLRTCFEERLDRRRAAHL
jgi:hypothetical protein